MTYYVFTNYGYESEGCAIETPSKADAIEVFKFTCEVSEKETLVELAVFLNSGEFVALESFTV